jgi:hypothetical protein
MSDQTGELDQIGEADEGSGTQRLIGILDGVAALVLVVFLAQIVAGAMKGVGQIAEFPRGLAGWSWEVLASVTGWADISIGLLALLSVGLIVLPRLLWGEDGPEEQPGRARLLLALTSATAAVTAVAAALFVVALVGFEATSGGSPWWGVTSSAAEYVGGLLLAGATGVLAWRSRSYWPTKEPADIRGDGCTPVRKMAG